MNVRIIASVAFLLAVIPIGVSDGTSQQAASRPTVEQVMNENRALREEVAALKRQVTELQARLNPKPFKNIEVGMTLDEAKEWLAGMRWRGVIVRGDVIRDVPDTTVYQAYSTEEQGGKVNLLFRVDNKTRRIIRIGHNMFTVSPSDADR
jgi:hypothetical protein